MASQPKEQTNQILDAIQYQDSGTADGSSSPISLLRLPHEVLLRICLHLEPKEAGKLRATNKFMNGIASEQTFGEILVFHCDDDLDMVRHLANDPLYSKCIRSLTLDANVLPVPPPYDEYKAAKSAREVRDMETLDPIDPPFHLTLSRRLEKLKLRDAHQRLILHQHQQMQIFINNTDYHFFQEIIPKLSNLQHVSVTLQREFDPLFWDPAEPKPPFDHWHGLPLRILRFNGVHQVDAVLMALAVSPSREKLRRLQLGGFHWDFINHLNDTPLKLDQVIDICRSLTTLEVAFRGESSEDILFRKYVNPEDIRSCRRAVSKGSLCKILAATPDLKELKLRFAYKWQDMGSRSRHNMCFPAAIDDFLPANYHWRNLQRVEFQNIECASHQLLDFLDCHASTLGSATFRNVRLVNESWLIFLPQMRQLMSRVAKLSLQAPRLFGIVCFAGFLYGTSMEAPYPVECWNTADGLNDLPEDGRNAWRIMFFIDSVIEAMPLEPGGSFVAESNSPGEDAELTKKIEEAWVEREEWIERGA